VTPPERVTSTANPLLVRIRRLARDGGGYRRLGQIWIEGEHLCAAAAWRGRRAAIAVLSESAWSLPARRELAVHADRVVLLPDSLQQSLSALESPSDIGFVLDLDTSVAADPTSASIVLDRLQDAGNVGSILRSASALGVGQVLAIKGTAALWSGKVLRAGMGAHFGLRLVEGLDESAVLALNLDLVVTSSHATLALTDARLPAPCAWVFGHEGQGVSPALEGASALQVRIPQPGGEESLNVAAAAAICLYEAARQSRFQ
jgi:TrmH family RNA methyltransferase